MRILCSIVTGQILLSLVFFSLCNNAHAQVFVDQNASGANDGSSWVNAYRDLQTALTLTTSGPIWVARGTYKPVSCNPCTSTQMEMAFRIPPDVQLYGGFAGTEANLAQRDWDLNPTILSGDIGVSGDSLDNSINVLIAVNATENTVLDGFIVEEGNADGSFGFAAGGGLFIDGNPGGTADIQVRNCTFRNNYAGGGGAIAIDCVLGGSSKALIRDCIFEGNTASLRIVSSGAAVFIQGNSGAKITPRFTNCIFRNNYCGNDGGAFAATPTGENSLLAPVIDSCLFENNRSDDRGGAIWYRMSSFGESRVVISNSRFIENSAGGQGGAIFARSSFDNAADDRIFNCLFSRNRSDGTSSVNDGKGGAIFLRGSQGAARKHAIINCVFDRNSADMLGGAVATTSAEVSPGFCLTDLINCSFYGNFTNGEGGAVHAQDSTGTNVLNIDNSIFWGDTAVVAGMEVALDRAIVTLSNCNIEGGLPAGFIDGGNITVLDPQYADPENGDLHLPGCSPLIDIGNNAVVPPEGLLDLDGDPRIHAGTVDLGAYEIGVIYVDQSATGGNNGRSWANAFNRFEDGLAAAAAGDQIWVARGTYYPTACNPCTAADMETAFHLPPDVEAYGGFAGNETLLEQRDWQTFPTILSGDIGTPGDSTDNVFNVLIAKNSTDKTILDGFIIEEGNADGSFGFAAGGGLFMDANPGGTADMQIRNCTFRNNYAGGGGALAIDCVLGGSSKALIRDCIFEHNTASLRITSSGAAVFIQGNSGAQITPRFINCTFRNNYCGNDGGAFSATPTGENSLLAFVIDSCLFQANRSDDRGGAVWYRMSSFGESRVTIKNSTFLENSAGGEGGALFARSSFDNVATDTLINCLFSRNSSDGSSTVNDGEGGAIFLRGSQQATRDHAIINCVFDRNNAALLGGAVATTSIEAAPGICRTNFVNCSFSGNRTSGDGGAIHMEGSQGENTTTLNNAILWDDQASINGPELWTNGGTLTVTHSDVAGGVPDFANDGGNNLDADPQFVDAAGGDLHLGPCSPVLDAGNNTLIPEDLIDLDGDGDRTEKISLDLDGLERIFQTTVDMGAYEFDGSEPALTLARNITDESCGGACDGAVTVVPAGGQAGYTFAWSGGQASPKLENLCAGTYYVTVNDASTCMLVDSIIIQPGDALGLTVSPDVEVCPGELVELLATASGGVGILTYNWDNELGAGQTQSVNPEATTTYSVTVTDFNGCSEMAGITVNVRPAPAPEIEGNNSFCPGGSTLLNGGDYSAYEWSTTALVQQIEVNTAGLYGLTVTDEFGCTGATEIEITESLNPEVAIEGDTAFCFGENTELQVGAFSTYEWSNGVMTPAITVSEAGLYSVTVTDENGCTGSSAVEVVESESPNAIINGEMSFCAGTGTVLESSESFAAYLWSNGSTGSSIEVNTAGSYGLTVTNESGCSNSAEVIITENPAPGPEISGDLDLCVGSNTILDVGVFAAYEWSTGASSQQIEVDSGGIYAVTVTDENGCVGSTQVEVMVADSIMAEISGSPTFCTGSSTLLEGASGFAAYLWSTGSTEQTITVTEAGDYSLTVTDSAGCSGSADISVTESPMLSPAISGNLTLCPGSNTTLDAGVFATYEWSNGESNQQISVDSPGTYSVTVSDGSGCTGIDEVSVVAADTVVVDISGSTTFCAGSTTILSGTPGFTTYLWSTGSTDPGIEVGEAGTYSLTITSEAGCNNSAEISISESPALSPTISGDLDLCADANTILDAGIFAGYAWSTGATSQQITVAGPGLYAVTVTDDNACTGSAQVAVTVADSITVEISGSMTFCVGSSTVLEGPADFTDYRWSNGSTEQTISVTEAGDYSLTVTDAAGCSGSADISVTESPMLSPAIIGNLTLCPGSSTTLDAGVFATYAWSNGESNQQINVDSPGSYSVTVSDGSGCTGTDEISVMATDTVVADISGSTIFCAGSTTRLAGTPGFAAYLWSTGSTDPTIEVGEAGMYSLTITNEAGCSDSTEINISESPSLSPIISGELDLCPGTATILDAGIFAVYEWSTGASSQQITVDNPGLYAVTVTDDNGCMGSAQVQVTVADSITVDISGSTTFCAGSSTVLEGPAGFAAYAWSTGSMEPAIDVSLAGIYGLTVTDAMGCSGVREIAVTESDSLSPVITGIFSICSGSSTILDAGMFATYTWSTGAGGSQIEVSAAGTYAVTVADGNGCTGSAQVEVTEADSLMVTISGTETFCTGTTATLEGPPGFATYSWSTGAGDPVITIEQGGMYGLTVTDAGGCSGMATTTIEQLPNPEPQIAGLTTFCPGDSTVLDAGAGYSVYNWSDGTSEQIIIVRTEGSYTVMVRDSNGCSGTAEVLISHDLPEAASVGPDISSCSDTIELSGNLPPGTTGLWTSSEDLVNITDPMAASTQATNFPNSEVLFTWTLSTLDCPDYSSDALSLFPGQGPVANPDLASVNDPVNRSIEVDLLANDILFGTANLEFRLLSRPSFGTLDSLGVGRFRYTAPATGPGTVVFAYELCVAGCPCTSADVTIAFSTGQMEENVVANTITPNGDGLNESFVFDIIRTTPPMDRPDNELIIFNRWGDIVFRMEDYDNSWNGLNSKGEKLPEATYYYILRLNIGEGVILRGDVTIMR